MRHRITRRRLLQSAAATSVVAVLPGVTRNALGANEKLRIAAVGTDGQAGANIAALQGQAIVALADVDSTKLGHRARSFPSVRTYADYRAMLEKEEKHIDAVLVATPDHHHATATAIALRMGKHVYCEKPLTHTPLEARILATLAKKYRCVTQMGTQIHAGDNYRRVVEAIQSGVIGKVTRVHTWVGTQYSGADNPARPPVPANLDWDLWLGPAPYRDYHAGLHPFHWRGWWDFGGGGLADMACHHMDLPFWALGLRTPTTIEAQGPQPHDLRCPHWLIVDYRFEARPEKKDGYQGGFLGEGSRFTGGPAVHLTWYNGDRRPDDLAKVTASLKPEQRGWGGGNLFQGDQGYLLADYGRLFVFDAEGKVIDDFNRPKEYIPRSKGHHAEWIEACKTGGPTTCNFDYAGALTEAVLLGNVAFRSGKKLIWDADRFTTGSAEADKFLDKEYRKGWDLVRQATA